METTATIMNRDGKRLAAIIHTPEPWNGRAVLMVHSFKGHKDYQPILAKCARRLCSEGFRVVRFDCAGSGESEGTFENATVRSEIRDLEDAISFTRQNGASSISLIGLSLGATVILYAKHDEAVRAIVLWSPAFDMRPQHKEYQHDVEKHGFITLKRALTGEDAKLGYEMWKEFGELDPANRVRETTAPTLIVYGTDDNERPTVEKYFSMLKAAKRLEIVEGGDHDWIARGPRSVAFEKTIEWIIKHP